MPWVLPDKHSVNQPWECIECHQLGWRAVGGDRFTRVRDQPRPGALSRSDQQVRHVVAVQILRRQFHAAPVVDISGEEVGKLGFPAGKSKTMVIELGDVLDREHPRFRLYSTLRLYWDAIQLAVDGGSIEFATINTGTASGQITNLQDMGLSAGTLSLNF